jgi:hypothetical protein
MESTAKVTESDLLADVKDQPADPPKKYVIKRDGTKAEIKAIRIKERLQGIVKDLNMDFINLDVITEKVYKGIYSGK